MTFTVPILALLSIPQRTFVMVESFGPVIADGTYTTAGSPVANEATKCAWEHRKGGKTQVDGWIFLAFFVKSD